MDGVLYSVQELQAGLLKHILQELVINEIVHPFEDCDPKRVPCSFCLVPQLSVELDVGLEPVCHSEGYDTVDVSHLHSMPQV